MKNYKMIQCLFGLMLLLMFGSELKAQNGCDDCFAYSDESYFCVKTKMEYGEERAYVYERNTCRPFRFTGMNVRPLARLDVNELNNMLTKTADVGATVIRFFAPNHGLDNQDAIDKVKNVLNTARNHADERVRNLKFIIVLVNFYGDASYWNDSEKYYPKITDGTSDPYEFRNNLFVLKSEWFNPSSDISYVHTYQNWVEDITDALSSDEYQQQILSFELGNELQNTNAKNNLVEQSRIRVFTTNTIGIIKDRTPKTLVSTGNVSTFHILVDDSSNFLADYREAVYRQSGDTKAVMRSKADFITVHNYNNEWSSGTPGYLRQDLDIAYAQDNDIPWLVEEFGYSGNLYWIDNGDGTQRYGGYHGGLWESPPDGSSERYILCTEPGEEGSRNRACNIESAINIYIGAGTMGVMAWGFNPPFEEVDWNRGIGSQERAFDIVFSADYEQLESAWRYGAMLFRGLSNYLYECETDMLIDSDPLNITDIACEGPGNMTVNHKINSNVNINYRASESIDFAIKNNGEGYDAPAGANVKAEVISTTTCLSCNTLFFPTCDLPKLQNTESDQYQFTIQPNPFSLQTEIIFTLTEDTPVTIYVTDMMGRNVAALVDNKMKTIGEHTVIFDGRGYPAGMYMTHIQAGEYSGTQKMILTK